MSYLNKKMALWKPPNHPNVELEVKHKKKGTHLERISINFNDFMKYFLESNLAYTKMLA